MNAPVLDPFAASDWSLAIAHGDCAYCGLPLVVARGTALDWQCSGGYNGKPEVVAHLACGKAAKWRAESNKPTPWHALAQAVPTALENARKMAAALRAQADAIEARVDAIALGVGQEHVLPV